ncbi:hypothetical protein JIG36_24740 [Actinoplanes sp. LDG1-06]|uniref:Uncharacterized protein n=1 Tax=Paractinoplanes ovalisporus TaxID=2810368 RepID=A0ABS2AG62_9ACTN|nr:hypothetical protein [Actinoplanes ovalisporus]MBM2618770.1 hypothetical protein [Actinoplanes ovalisporus]
MNDEEQQLRNRLERIIAPPSRLEAETMLDAGRRQVFRRRSWQAAGGVALATGVVVAVPVVMREPDAAPPAPAYVADSVTPVKKNCQMTALAMPKGAKEATAEGVDPSGRYIIGHDFSGQNFKPILWTDGVPKRLPQVEKSVQLTTVNASGVVAGLATEGNLEYAFRYENGRYTRLKTPPGDWHIYPWPMMNAAGDIVINAEPDGKIEGEDSIALFWAAGSTTAVKLPLPEEANVYDITDDGMIVGGSFVNGEGRDAYVWDRTGHGRKLAAPAGMRSVAYAAEGDWATGGLWPATGSGKPALWNLKTGAVTKLDGDGPGDSVNRDQLVVASGKLIRDGKVVGLPAPKGQETSARAVANTGLIVGVAQDASNDGPTTPRTWKC